MTCELETDLGWYYQAYTKCASRVITVGGSLYCDKCKMPMTAVPRQLTATIYSYKICFLFECFLACVLIYVFKYCRFKIHVQVIDNTGSTTFVLFDRVVSQFLGRNVQDLLDGMGNVCSFSTDKRFFYFQ